MFTLDGSEGDLLIGFIKSFGDDSVLSWSLVEVSKLAGGSLRYHTKSVCSIMSKIATGDGLQTLANSINVSCSPYTS